MKKFNTRGKRPTKHVINMRNGKIDHEEQRIALDLRKNKEGREGRVIGFLTDEGWIISDREKSYDQELGCDRPWSLVIPQYGLYQGPDRRSVVYIRRPIAKLGGHTLCLPTFAGYSASRPSSTMKVSKENEVVLYPEKSEKVEGYIYYGYGDECIFVKDKKHAIQNLSSLYPVTAIEVKDGARGRIGHILEDGKKVPLYAIKDMRSYYTYDIRILNWPKELNAEIEAIKEKNAEKAKSSSNDYPAGLGWGHGSVDW